MSKYALLIFPVAIILFVIIFDLIPIEIGPIEINQKYDCAKTFDKMITAAKQPQTDTITTMSLMPLSIIQSNFNMYEFMDNRCYTTIKSWASQSEHELLIWKANWQDWSYIEQIFNHEVDCPTDEKILCELKL